MPTTSAAPGTKSSAVVEIDRLGLKYEEVADYDLSRIGDDRPIQVREVRNYVPRDAVERFAVMMGESPFPPIIVTADDRIVDGNTRVEARKKRKEKFSPAIQLEVSWDGASEKQRDDLIILAATLNSMSGTPLTEKERRMDAAAFIERGFKTEQIARAIGLKPSSISAVKREIDASAKLSKVGLDSNGGLRGASLRALGSAPVLSLNDVPFKDLAQLAADAGLNAGEIVATAKAAKETGSDTAQVDLIAKERAELKERIREHSLTGVGKPPLARQLRQRLGFVTKFAGREQELVETNAAMVVQHVEALNQTIAVLIAALKAQES